MRRRSFAAIGLALGVLAAALVAGAQGTRRVPRVGIVAPTSPSVGRQSVDAFRKRIADFVLSRRIPTMAGQREFAVDGVLMSYGPSIPDSYRRGAAYVDRILKGAKPADLPVEQPTKFELVVNLRTARAFGLALSPPIVIRADAVIE